jgi:hypothetical protein
MVANCNYKLRSHEAKVDKGDRFSKGQDSCDAGETHYPLATVGTSIGVGLYRQNEGDQDHMAARVVRDRIEIFLSHTNLRDLEKIYVMTVRKGVACTRALFSDRCPVLDFVILQADRDHRSRMGHAKRLKSGGHFEWTSLKYLVRWTTNQRL